VVPGAGYEPFAAGGLYGAGAPLTADVPFVTPFAPFGPEAPYGAGEPFGCRRRPTYGLGRGRLSDGSRAGGCASGAAGGSEAPSHSSASYRESRGIAANGSDVAGAEGVTGGAGGGTVAAGRGAGGRIGAGGVRRGTWPTRGSSDTRGSSATCGASPSRIGSGLGCGWRAGTSGSTLVTFSDTDLTRFGCGSSSRQDVCADASGDAAGAATAFREATDAGADQEVDGVAGRGDSATGLALAGAGIGRLGGAGGLTVVAGLAAAIDGLGAGAGAGTGLGAEDAGSPWATCGALTT
jgi:hypothetical protein